MAISESDNTSPSSPERERAQDTPLNFDRLMTKLRDDAKQINPWVPSVSARLLEAVSRLEAVSCMQPIPQRNGDSTVSYSEMQRRLHGLSK